VGESVTTRHIPHLQLGVPHVIRLSGNVTARIYGDSRPHNLKTAQLQKGLVLALNGEELAEEGVGIGVPVAIFKDDTYFSTSGELSAHSAGGETIVKRFILDSVSRKSWKIRALVNNPLYRRLTRAFVHLYRDYATTRKALLTLIRLRNRAGVRTVYTKRDPRGQVEVEYRVKEDTLYVSARFSGLDKRNLRKIVVLNEQGSSFFRKFHDSNGSILIDDQIGAWEPVATEWACLSDPDDRLGFCLRRLGGCRLFVGREQLKGHLAWSGLAYEVPSDVDSLSYMIKILTGDGP
jgi:hypothetical protein